MPNFNLLKRLDHTPPNWVDSSTALYFITICCEPRGKNQLANPQIAKAITDALEFRVKQGLLYPYLLLLMPDHLHAIIGYNSKTQSLSNIISSLKQRLAQQSGIKWQRRFFDHRIRDDKAYKEKVEYILNNPVRAKLCEKSENWPYAWDADRLESTGRRPCTT